MAKNLFTKKRAAIAGIVGACALVPFVSSFRGDKNANQGWDANAAGSLASVGDSAQVAPKQTVDVPAEDIEASENATVATANAERNFVFANSGDTSRRDRPMLSPFITSGDNSQALQQSMVFDASGAGGSSFSGSGGARSSGFGAAGGGGGGGGAGGGAGGDQLASDNTSNLVTDDQTAGMSDSNSEAGTTNATSPITFADTPANGGNTGANATSPNSFAGVNTPRVDITSISQANLVQHAFDIPNEDPAPQAGPNAPLVKQLAVVEVAAVPDSGSALALAGLAVAAVAFGRRFGRSK